MHSFIHSCSLLPGWGIGWWLERERDLLSFVYLLPPFDFSPMYMYYRFKKVITYRKLGSLYCVFPKYSQDSHMVCFPTSFRFCSKATLFMRPSAHYPNLYLSLPPYPVLFSSPSITGTYVFIVCFSQLVFNFYEQGISIVPCCHPGAWNSAWHVVGT